MATPLEGMKILDFSTLLPGPFATMMLGDLGAEVLRVEAPNRPDLLRMNLGGHGTLNRNKQSIALNLKVPASIGIVKRLVQEYDIVLEQFRPGVMKSLGLDYETLKKENPKLIYCSLTGYGQDGPLAKRAGHDINYLSLSVAIGSARDQAGFAESFADIDRRFDRRSGKPRSERRTGWSHPRDATAGFAFEGHPPIRGALPGGALQQTPPRQTEDD